MTNTYTKTRTMTTTNTFRDYLQRAIQETCELWDFGSGWLGDITWPNKKSMTKTNTKTKTMTKTNTLREHLQRAILETCDLWDIWSGWWGDMAWPKKVNDKDKDKDNGKDNTFREHLQRANPRYLWPLRQRDPRDFWDLRHWLQFWQLRTWFHDNLCYLTIKSDTGQHSQFLRCFIVVTELLMLKCAFQPMWTVWREAKPADRIMNFC